MRVAVLGSVAALLVGGASASGPRAVFEPLPECVDQRYFVGAASYALPELGGASRGSGDAAVNAMDGTGLRLPFSQTAAHAGCTACTAMLKRAVQGIAEMRLGVAGGFSGRGGCLFFFFFFFFVFLRYFFLFFE
jgi:hypothetical protein